MRATVGGNKQGTLQVEEERLPYGAEREAMEQKSAVEIASHTIRGVIAGPSATGVGFLATQVSMPP